jgi:hypothetical protein
VAQRDKHTINGTAEMALDLFSCPIDKIKFEDLRELTSRQEEEGTRLEFKGELSTNDGTPDRWMRDQKHIGSVARDDIAKEVVAFANAYGGIIIIGIEESADHPKRAMRMSSAQIPRVADCADRLGRSLQEIIEPPLPPIAFCAPWLRKAMRRVRPARLAIIASLYEGNAVDVLRTSNAT